MTPEKSGMKKNKFCCDFVGCGKSFSRKDHLRRHNLNHDENASLHECSYPGCNKKFKRYDVMNGHYERHFRNKRTRILIKNTSTSHFNTPIGVVSDQNQAYLPIEQEQNIAEFGQEDLIDWLFSSQDLLYHNPGLAVSTNLGTNSSTHDYMTLKQRLPSSLIFESSPNSMLSELFKADFDTAFTFPTNSSLVTLEMMATFVHLIPSLVQFPDFNIPSLEYCLKFYWSIFHVQFPIVHKPSFNSLTAQPLLVLSMIMIGSILSCSAREVLKDPSGFSIEIGKELRWLIFKNRKHGSSQPWELQSLLILEVYEKHFANRDLHERSSVHHAAKVEMMKRSTVLGGDPYASESRSSTDLKENQGEILWNKWVAAESMKRCALMSFCFDLTSSIISSHNSILFVDKLKLALPCDDLLWEASLNNFKDFSLPAKPDSIRDCLGKLLRGQHIETTSLGKKVLFHCLSSLILQFESKDELVSLISGVEHDILKDAWREKLSYALDVLKYNIDKGCCSNIENLLLNVNAIQNNDLGALYFQDNDSKCKFPSYHMAHIRLHMVNHDMLIYSGVPLRMNVESQIEDYDNVAIRMKRWASSSNGRVGVLHAYLCLFECLLDGKEFNYSPRLDPIPERSHVIVACTLIIWCYNFVMHGPESNYYYSCEGRVFEETAEEYLNRLRSLFMSLITPNNNAVEFHISVRKCATNLPQYNTHYIAGFMNEMSVRFASCFWALGREYSRLFSGCKERSQGKKEIFCINMYKDE